MRMPGLLSFSRPKTHHTHTATSPEMPIFAAAIFSHPDSWRNLDATAAGLNSGFSLRMRQTSPAKPKTGRPSRKVNPLLALIKNKT